VKGCIEAILTAHGFTVELMVELVRAGFALTVNLFRVEAAR
jgi:hypothetical protein